MALLWETYDLGARDGNAKYTVTVNVEREEKGGLAGFDQARELKRASALLTLRRERPARPSHPSHRPD